jgi:uncharacterized protein YcfJ
MTLPGVQIGTGSAELAKGPRRAARARAATMAVLLAGTSPLGALLGGVLGTAIGVRHALWVLFAIAAVSGTVMLTRDITTRRDLPATAPPGHIETAA